MNEKLLTVDEIATLCDVSPFTVRRWIKTGKLKATMLIRASGYRVSREDLEAFQRSTLTPSEGTPAADEPEA